MGVWRNFKFLNTTFFANADVLTIGFRSRGLLLLVL
jgi:hypothetical protein